MPILSRLFASHAPVARSIAMTALLGASFVATPLTATYAAETQPAAQAGAADGPSETVEQRITSLHTELKITEAEESKWNGVAQAMRENAAAMEKLAAAKTGEAPSSMTAVEDLKNYEKYAQAHVDGLKNLISSFETLYVSFPDAQKKTADEVFQTFGQKHASHS
jgi:hypothetical protein